MVTLEWANPTGSMKDRMARTSIEGPIGDGRLQPGDTVVEYIAGTTGIYLAFVCAALGYDLHIVFSDAFSMEKRRTMKAFGATVEEAKSDHGRSPSRSQIDDRQDWPSCRTAGSLVV